MGVDVVGLRGKVGAQGVERRRDLAQEAIVIVAAALAGAGRHRFETFRLGHHAAVRIQQMRHGPESALPIM